MLINTIQKLVPYNFSGTTLPSLHLIKLWGIVPGPHKAHLLIRCHQAQSGASHSDYSLRPAHARTQLLDSGKLAIAKAEFDTVEHLSIEHVG